MVISRLNTATIEPPAKHPQKILVVCALLTLVVLSAHAVIKHGNAAEAVRQCMDKNGIYEKWVKPDGRVIWLCHMDDGRWGVQIWDPWEKREITAFPKEKMSRLSQVQQWLRNMGASPVTPRY